MRGGAGAPALLRGVGWIRVRSGCNDQQPLQRKPGPACSSEDAKHQFFSRWSPAQWFQQAVTHAADSHSLAPITTCFQHIQRQPKSPSNTDIFFLTQLLSPVDCFHWIRALNTPAARPLLQPGCPSLASSSPSGAHLEGSGSAFVGVRALPLSPAFSHPWGTSHDVG